MPNFKNIKYPSQQKKQNFSIFIKKNYFVYPEENPL